MYTIAECLVECEIERGTARPYEDALASKLKPHCNNRKDLLNI